MNFIQGGGNDQLRVTHGSYRLIKSCFFVPLHLSLHLFVYCYDQQPYIALSRCVASYAAATQR